MTLRQQLLCIILLTLALPWAGCQYARELEITLRENQINTLMEIAHSASQQLSESMHQAQQGHVAFHAAPLPAPAILDGYADEWQHVPPQHFTIDSNGNSPHNNVLASNSLHNNSLNNYSLNINSLKNKAEPPQHNNAQHHKKITLQAGVFHRRVYLLLTIPDSSIHYFNPTQSGINGDRLTLTLWPNHHTDTGTTLVLNTSAPGAINVTGTHFRNNNIEGNNLRSANVTPNKGRANGEVSMSTFTAGIEGTWQQTDTGYNIELTLPIERLAGELQFTYTDARPAETQTISPTPPEYDQNNVLHFVPDYEDEDDTPSDIITEYLLPKGQVILPDAELKKILEIYARRDRKLYVINADAWLLAQNTWQRSANPSGTVFQPAKRHHHHTHSLGTMLEGLLQQFYHLILSDKTTTLTQQTGPYQGRFIQPYIGPLLSGTPQGHWQQTRLSKATITAAFPITDPQTPSKTLGAVILEQRTDPILSVQNHAISRLFRLSFTAIAIITLALILFVGLLSYRIKRLSQAAQHVLSADGEFSEKIKVSTIPDEIGELSRSLVTLQTRLGQYTHYLKTLASKLSHELRTPLTIVRSSLENLEMNDNCDVDVTKNNDSKIYIQRANEGLDRLRHIVNTMSSASRLEQSIVNAEKEHITLNDNLKNLVESYQLSAPQNHITLSLPSMPITINGNNELLAQMLDKLFENALAFTPVDKNIIFELSHHNNKALITVSNDGPLLPDIMQHHLFDSLVSLRNDAKDTVHLGLGLYIVKLIVEFHCGQVKAENRPDNTGVVFSISLPCS